jgi:hypothetical protein
MTTRPISWDDIDGSTCEIWVGDIRGAVRGCGCTRWEKGSIECDEYGWNKKSSTGGGVEQIVYAASSKRVSLVHEHAQSRGHCNDC